MNVKQVVQLYDYQAAFLRDTASTKLFVGGYGSGKTFTGLQVAKDMLQRWSPYAFILIGGPDYPLLTTSYIEPLKEEFELLKINYKYNSQHHLMKIESPYLKGKIRFLSYKDPAGIVSFNATGAILDELDTISPKKAKNVYNKILGRLRGCEKPQVVVVTTPEGFRFTYELSKKDYCSVHHAKTTDNKSLPDDYIDNLLEQYDEKHVDMYVNGNFVNLHGNNAIYNFDRNKHVIPALCAKDIQTFEHLTIGMDFNVDPFCMTVSAMWNGVKITFDEFYIRNQGAVNGYSSYVDKALNMLLNKYPNATFALRKEKTLDNKVNKVYTLMARPDATGRNRSVSAAITPLMEIKSYGIGLEAFIKNNPAVTDRLNVANTALSKGNALITENCVNLIEDIEKVTVDQYGEIDKKNNDKMRTHILDAWTYDVYWEFFKTFARGRHE